MKDALEQIDELQELIKDPKNYKRFCEETIIVNMIGLRFHKMKKRLQIKYLKKLLRRMKKQL